MRGGEPWRKQRQLRLEPTGKCAGTGILERLRAEPGVEAADWTADGRLQLRYDLRNTGLDRILALLASLDLRPRCGRMTAWRHAWWAWTEAMERGNLACPGGWDRNLRAVYLAGDHRPGRRDNRPQHWRHYLDRETP